MGYFSSEERGISPWLFGVCVATLFVVAALTSEKTETVSGASAYVYVLFIVCVCCVYHCRAQVLHIVSLCVYTVCTFVQV